MKAKITLLVAFILINYCQYAFPITPSDKEVNSWVGTPVSGFIENKGQLCDMNNMPAPYLLFKLQDRGTDVYITNSGLSYVLKFSEENPQNTAADDKDIKGLPDDLKQKDLIVHYCRADMELVGADIRKENIIKEIESKDYINYYLSHCPDGVMEVRSYGKITIKEVYPGIDWVIYNTTAGGMKYDFVVHPNADPSLIKLRYKWTDKPEENESSVTIATPLGFITEGKPYAYNSGNAINVSYKIEDMDISFQTGEYNTDETLIIDPQLLWASYYGGTGDDQGRSINSDGTSVWVTGWASSTDFPLQSLTGAYNQGTYGGGNYDAFLLKFNTSGVRSWATYYGGSIDDFGNSIHSDGTSVWVTGQTYSTDFPLQSLSGAYNQATYGGGSSDAFILKFNTSGVRQWATYYGGTGNYDNGSSIYSDGTNVWITGYTGSANFPLQSLSGAYNQGTHGGSAKDVFILKFSTLGVRNWATFYGGFGEDEGNSIHSDGISVWLTGQTQSTNLPLQNLSGAYNQSTLNNNGSAGSDAFILKFSTSGVRSWATYYGGTGFDYGSSIHSNGTSLWVTGSTQSSTTFPVQSLSGAYNQGTSGGSSDAFILKFSTSGVRQWATFYGGADIEYAYSIQSDGTSVWITGFTNSTNFPLQNSSGAYNQGTYGGSSDAFVLKFSTSGVRDWATYYGGTGIDIGYYIHSDGANVWVTGRTQSTDLPLQNLSGAYNQGTNGGGNYDGFILHFDGCVIPATPGSISGATTTCEGVTNTYSIAPISGATSYTWTLPSGWTGTSTSSSINATAGPLSGNITVIANNACGSSAPQSLAITVNPLPPQPGSITGNNVICSGTSNTYSISPVSFATSYTWTLPAGWTGTSTTTSIATAASATSGNITVKANNACGFSSLQTLPVTVNSIPVTPGPIIGNASICSSSSNTYSITAVSGATSYTWTLPVGWSGTSTTTSIATTSNTTGGDITVTAINSCGSSNVQTLAVTVNIIPSQPAAIAGNTTICSGTSNTYSISPVIDATSYTWTLPSGWTGNSTTTSITTTVGTSGGNVTVSANNACGSSPIETLAVIVNTPPATPGAITGNIDICSGSSNTYSISAVSGATSYTWTLPSGWTGTSTITSITSTSSLTSGNVTVSADNACGSSPIETLAVTVNTAPATPGAITGNSTVCADSSNTYSVTPVSGATSYTWALPSGWSGTSTTNSIVTTAGAANGNISVTANNICGSSSQQVMAITVNPLPAQPVAISGISNVCSGNSYTYSISPVIDATSYTWTLPSGWTGSSSTTSITATASLTSGNVSVTANNSCGSSIPQTLSIIVNSVLSQPSAISGNTEFCEGSGVQYYSVVDDLGAIDYTWTLPTGWSGTSTTHDITATPGISGGLITVVANNMCGASTQQTLAVTIYQLPVVSIDFSAIDTLCVYGSDVSLTGGLPTGGTYSGTAVSSGVFSPSLAGAGTYIITYTYTDGNSCTNSIIDSIFVDVCTGIPESVSNFSYSVYPNPISEIVTVSITGNSCINIQLVITDMAGKVLMQMDNCVSETVIDLSDYSTGVYLLIINTPFSDEHIKLLKQ